ncbi:Beta-xylosidase [Mucilaginibacter mallensis]|uniref:Beta-xylosidase n=1 Tax=Mucilaginibacter mallensis TaxID=652787 RepID=A0A1H2CBG3_MUCMA|nr:beta-galactosidase [Mucilaginibacter mallensis]SDT67577.1 Beta-xylosidase [Mucilaginibacter mallensis]
MTKAIKRTVLLFSLLFYTIGLFAQVKKQQTQVWTPDNGNGTFTNPLMWGDWPDPDIIRVGDEFYFISTSMHYVPGCPIAKSKDLVNWEMAGYAVPRYDEDPRYDMKGGSMYLNGSWASTLRYHNGTFYAGFCTPSGFGTKEGHFSICTAKDVNGPWTRTIFKESLYDPGLFFDDDGKVYVAHGQQKLFITELNSDARSVKVPQKEIYNNPKYPYLEGSHLYKVNGKYYLLGSTGGTKGRQVCLRSDNIYGPYESKVVINDDHTYPGNGLHQGGMVQLKDGSWWFIIMQDRGPIGRVPNLEPVTWVDGWPMLGENGKGVDTFKKPNVGGVYPITVPATADEFNSPKLGLQWQWNHNPDPQKWSLTEHKGYMQLKANNAKNLADARNTLTQRVQGPYSEGSVEMQVNGMKDGDVAGFGVFQFPYAFVSVQQNGTKRTIVMVNNDTTITTVNFTGNTIWFKASVTHIGFKASFAYSVDGKNYQPIGNELKMGLGLDWTANRFALFNYNTNKTGVGGYADFNWFHYTNIEPAKSSASVPVIKQFAHPDRIRYDGNSMKIEGKDFFMYSAAFHYFRCPKELWRDRFKKIKEAGFNTVETYVPWNWHERDMPASISDTSKFDFTDLKEWLKMAQDEFGLYTVVRPGPFICAEWSGGGYPQWLAKYGPGKGDFWLRSADPEHIKWSEHWYNAVCKVLAKEQLTRKPKGSKGIIMVQIENEYDAFDGPGKEDLLRALYRSAKNNGIDVPIFTCLTAECRESKKPELSQVFDCDNYYVGLNEAPSCAYRMAQLRRSQPDAPGFVTELQGGWFSLVTGRLSDENYSDARHFNAIGLMSLLGGASGLNYYMFYGGTHFAGWGARGMTTSYDYNAAIRENGELSPKYFAAKGIGEFIKKYGDKLLYTQGGPCELKVAGNAAPKELFGGVRIAPDGTKFVFLHNTDAKKSLSGTITIVPGKIVRPADPIYNINQNGEKVLISTTGADTSAKLTISPFEVNYELADLGAKVLVIPPGATPDKGEWWPKSQTTETHLSQVPARVRIATAVKHDDPFAEAKWQPLEDGKSLSEIGVNDFRYSYYRCRVNLNADQVATETKLLFNMFTRDIVMAQVNGKLAKRIFPDKADAQSWPTRDCFTRIDSNTFDNQFDVTGLLKKGDNEIVVVYENLGHAHGYMPMEELAGIKKGGLSNTTKSITQPLQWQVAQDLAGVTNGWTLPDFDAKKWKKVALDTITVIPRKGNRIQPKNTPTALVTWYRVEFELPASASQSTWLARINASGNGYMWLNGNNIGRHWEVGPQREFYLPECWLKFGKGEKNVLVFGLRQTDSGAFIKALEIAPYSISSITAL